MVAAESYLGIREFAKILGVARGQRLGGLRAVELLRAARIRGRGSRKYEKINMCVKHAVQNSD
jgi:hypothetical protein